MKTKRTVFIMSLIMVGFLTTACNNTTFKKNDIVTTVENNGSQGGNGNNSNQPDTAPPVITLNGNSSITLEYGSTYSEAGATATDNVDGSVSVTISGDVNTSKLGTYTITYTATDSVGNTATKTRTVSIVDTTPPVITLNGNSSITLEYGSTYSEAGATATDNVDGSVSVSVSGDVNTSKLGTYTITYTATDSVGNTATKTRIVSVVDTAPPVIVLNGNSSITLEVGSAYSEAGATATDNVDGSVSISISGSVDTNAVGTYTITYTATDSSGNTATKTRSVEVIPKQITQLVIPKTDLPAECPEPKKVNLWSAIMEDYYDGTMGTNLYSIDYWEINQTSITENDENFTISFPEAISVEASYYIPDGGNSYTAYRNIHATVYCFDDRNATWDDAGKEVLSYHLKALGDFQRQSIDMATIFVRQYDSDVDTLPSEINGGYEPNRLAAGVTTSIPMISHWPVDDQTNVFKYGMVVHYKDTNMLNGEIVEQKFLSLEIENNKHYQNEQSLMYHWQFDGHNGFIAAPYYPFFPQTQVHFLVPLIVLQNKEVVFGDYINNPDFSEVPDVKFEWGVENYPTWMTPR